jgi:hypothetical protein
MKSVFVFCLLFAISCFGVSQTNDLLVAIGNFSRGELSGWQEKVFNRKTDYTLVQIDDKTVVRAESHQAASGLFKEIRVDLEKTPFLNWSWKIEQPLASRDEKIKAGDDFAARVYVVIKTGSWFWNLNAINYVWSSLNPIDSRWPNATTSKAWVIAVETGNRQAGQWKYEKRDVRQDYLDCFKQEIRYIDSVAIMTDTDNTGSSAVAYYGDIYFSAE